MTDQNKKISLIGALSIFIVLISAVIYLALTSSFSFFKKPAVENTAVAPKVERLSGQDANSLAFVRARGWQADAVLAKMNTLPGKTDLSGHSDDWELWYISENKKGTAYRVTIVNQAVGEAGEVPYFGEGETLPAGLISSEEAVARARRIKGYEQEPIISVEMIYGPDGKEWYWGVKTAKGVVSIKATK